ncbi:MAG: beta-hexosaminidase [Oscillospiraceae bacterium]|nr:beta-hexosaminidase [Oscillospiraceae bacterium]
MDLEEKVGQMFFVRCPELFAKEKISQYQLGGYLLFSRDFQGKDEQQVIDMINAYQAEATIPLLIGADEEGGTVVRLSRNNRLFPEKFKSPQALYSTGGLEAIQNDALDKSAGLLRYGVNVNFAPVADVSTDPADFIYDRAFGQDAATTAEYVSTVVSAVNGWTFQEESDEKNVKLGSVLKHFPGYGNNVDTHTGIAIDNRPYEQFEQSDFLPFRSGIEAGAGAVLVSHNIVNCMDPDFPASLSAGVHRILRDELNFNGVILTDDLAMDAVEAYAADGSVAVLAVLAGNDMIVTTDFEAQIPLVIDAVRAGLIDETMLDEAVTRVLSWKYDLGLLQ